LAVYYEGPIPVVCVNQITESMALSAERKYQKCQALDRVSLHQDQSDQTSLLKIAQNVAQTFFCQAQ
jgi:hypothetical protein